MQDGDCNNLKGDDILSCVSVLQLLCGLSSLTEKKAWLFHDFKKVFLFTWMIFQGMVEGKTG